MMLKCSRYFYKLTVVLEIIKKKKQYKAVFRTRIDFNYDESQQKSMFSGYPYYIEQGSKEKLSYTNITDEAARIINSELKSLRTSKEKPDMNVRKQSAIILLRFIM